MIAERAARATDGRLTMTGIRGSIYGAMHIDRIVWRTDEQLVVATNVDLDWSPRQLLSSGIEISKLHAADLRMETLRESEEPATMPTSLASPFPIILDDALVYCDDDRINMMFDALNRAGRHQQIIVLTCRLRSFAPLGGNTLRVQTSGELQ